jgi:glycosyltransferase involved in cell wall biosynthesis
MLALGVSRVQMGRHLGLGDFAAIRHVSQRAIEIGADVVHGHGAKGGAYARLATTGGAARVYTPHGGSLHFMWVSPVGFLYLGAERALIGRTDLFLFESKYSLDTFSAKVGSPRRNVAIVYNGIGADEFHPVVQDASATDLLFIGELRHLKGVDILVDAIGVLAARGDRVTATIVGEGTDRARLEARVADVCPNNAVRFVGAVPARSAFALGRLLIVPSRAESLPYVVLEGAAAGLPVIAARVGGMAEIFGPDEAALVEPDNADRLADAIANALRDPTVLAQRAKRLQARIRATFSLDAMTDDVLAHYRDALAAKRG